MPVSELSRTSESALFSASGSLLNFLAQGHRILHPPPGVSPNVYFYDMEVEAAVLPRRFFRYLPCLSYQLSPLLRLLAVVTAKELHDDQELFVNYWDVLAVQKELAPDWMGQPPLPADPFLVKKHYNYNNAVLRIFAHNSPVSPQLFTRVDIEQVLARKIDELIPRLPEK